MTSTRILVSDPLAEEGLALLRQAGFQVDVKTGLPEPELLKIIPDYDALLVRSATQANAAMFAAGTKLRLVGRAGIGVDNIDQQAATRRGIVVMNTPDANATTTAELALTMMMALARKIPQADRSVREGKWEKSKFVGTEISGKTLGVAGFGRIGRIVADRALGLKMRVIAHDPFLQGASPVPGIPLVDFNTLLRESDFITVHSPLNEGTKNLFHAGAFAKMKPGAKLINCARGGIVNEKDLFEALQSQRLAGAALDVFSEEPPKGSPLLTLSNAIFTPHLGASTDEAQLKVSVDLAQQVIDFFLTGTARNAVNAPAIPAEVSERLRPFVALGERLGAFLAQTLDAPVRKIEITYRGEIHALDLAPVRTAVLCGVIRPSLDAPVNQVNAPLLAQERGITVMEAKEAKSLDYLNLLRVKVVAGEKTAQAAGTVFGRSPRFVEVDGFRLDAVPEGDLLVTRHLDRPGMIGKLGTIMGAHNINISRLQLGTLENGGASGQAMAILNIDQPLPAPVLAELRKVPNIVDARYVRL